jgi:uncharacterized damage-inducible protein DinB
MEPHLGQRHDPSLEAAERPMLEDWLEYHRATLALKCAGLDDEQLRLRAVPPSNLSLVGLVRHMAEVERTWFRRVLAGEPIPLVYSDAGDYQVAYDAAEADVEEAFTIWRAEIEQARAIEARAADLAVTGYHPKWQEHVSLRWVLIHMIEEYARHNGHADFLREAIDGRTGE